MQNGTKLRILYLYQHLVRHTDAEHPKSTVELMKMLKSQYDITVSRNTISNDLIMLHNCGLHIEHFESTQNKYYFDGHVYELAELKILVDAISSSKFITKRKSEELIAKLLSLTTDYNANKLRRHIFTEGRVKSDNSNGYYIVDAINEAIDIKRKISFRYVDYDASKNKIYTNNGNPYIVSPYALVWDGVYYYLRGYCDDRQAMRTFRLDRIDTQPEILDQIAVMAPDDYIPAEYSKIVFRMLDKDETEKVELLCNVSMMKYLIDNFGYDVDTEKVDDQHFKAHITVCTSSTFYRWVFGFGRFVKIMGPSKVVEEYRKHLIDALSDYE